MRCAPALTALLLLPLLTGCGVPTAADWRRCSFEVTEIAFQGLRENQAEWRVVVSAVNPNAKRLRLESLQLRALMQEDTLARMRNPDPIDLPPHDTTLIAFDVVLPQAAWNKALRAIRQTGSSELLIAGDAVVPTFLGTRTFKNVVREKHTLDLSSLMGGMGGEFFRNLFFR